MPAMAAVAAMRVADSSRLLTGTREMSSTVASRARGGQAEMAWLMGLGRACRMLAATEAATPMVRVARTAHRTRCRLVVTGSPPGWGGRRPPEAGSGGVRGWWWSWGLVADRDESEQAVAALAQDGSVALVGAVVAEVAQRRFGGEQGQARAAGTGVEGAGGDARGAGQVVGADEVVGAGGRVAVDAVPAGLGGRWRVEDASGSHGRCPS